MNKEDKSWEWLCRLAKSLKCLPSTYADGNEHLITSAENLNARIAELEAQLEKCTQLLSKHWPASMSCNGYLQVAGHLGNILAQLAEHEEWYASLMEHCVDGYYKCEKCGGPVAEGLVCAWCGDTAPSEALPTPKPDTEGGDLPPCYGGSAEGCDSCHERSKCEQEREETESEASK